MVSFAGWDMPVCYRSGTAQEVLACRHGIGLFDVSHMAEFHITGSQALAFLQYVTTNDVARLSPGKSQYSLLANEHGGVIDDIIVTNLAEDDYLVVANAGCYQKDWEWFSEQAKLFDVSLVDETNETALIAVQGPAAIGLISELGMFDASQIKRFHAGEGSIAGVPCRISRTGYTGEDGCELFCTWASAPRLWTSLVSGGGVPCGLGARDILRLEAAYPLYGHELNEDVSPLTAGLQWAVKTAKADFIGKRSIVEQAEQGIRDVLVGLTVVGERVSIPRQDCSVYTPSAEAPVGRVTSGTLSPTVDARIALALVSREASVVGTSLEIDIRGRRVECTVTKLPFYRNGV
jgi:aminomethyltransferase